MNKAEWFLSIEGNDDLLWLIKTYHPSRKNKSNLKITAPNAELACERIRSKIKNETKEDVVDLFRRALKEEDEQAVLRIFNDAWFGVPESTDCWKIPGFKELVELIEEAP